MLESRGPAATVLVVDDEALIRRALRRVLERQGYRVLTAESGARGLELASSGSVDLVLIDLWMPGLDGHALLARLRSELPDVVCVVITAHGTAEDAFRALDAGAADYVEKPIADWELFFDVLERALEGRRAPIPTVATLADEPGPDQLLGHSPAMFKLRALIRDVSLVQVPVLITGESGSGKERVARAIHANGPSREGPFLAVNCAALPQALMESELFGHERGAFVGAERAHRGLFEQAKQGTLLLDAIGDTPLDMQTKLLRVLEEQTVRRLGASRPVRVTARVVATTHADLPSLIRAGRFREDLYYRLNVVQVRVPPLRERREDVGLLAWHFVRRCNADYGKSVRSIHPEALRVLQDQQWARNNVRELENAVRRAMVLVQSDELTPDLFGRDLGRRRTDAVAGTAAALAPELHGLPYTEAKRALVERFSREYLQRCLTESGGNISQAARIAGQQRPNFKKLMRRFGIATSASARDDGTVRG